VPGIGKILALVILYDFDKLRAEVWNIGRSTRKIPFSAPLSNV
jgi:hypothetical protein